MLECLLGETELLQKSICNLRASVRFHCRHEDSLRSVAVHAFLITIKTDIWIVQDVTSWSGNQCRLELFMHYSRCTLHNSSICIQIWKQSQIHNNPFNIRERNTYDGGRAIIFYFISSDGCVNIYAPLRGSTNARRYEKRCPENFLPIMYA